MMTFSPLPLCRMFAALILFGAFAVTVQAQQKPITPEKAMMMGYVEDFLMNKAGEITMRQSLEWGGVQTDNEGNRTIRYKFEALIRDKENMLFYCDFTFDKDGNYVGTKHVEGFPKPAEKPDVTTLDGVKKLVEKFFAQNFRDITTRKTVQWGEMEKQENGHVALVYRYEAVLWEEDITLDERRFVFDKEGQVVSFDRTSKDFPKTIGKVENKWDVSTLEAVKKLVEKFFSQNYMDISARKMIRWGDIEKHDDGSVSLVYCYEATIQGKDKIVRQQRFTFDKNGKFVKVEDFDDAHDPRHSTSSEAKQ